MQRVQGSTGQKRYSQLLRQELQTRTTKYIHDLSEIWHPYLNFKTFIHFLFVKAMEQFSLCRYAVVVRLVHAD